MRREQSRVKGCWSSRTHGSRTYNARISDDVGDECQYILALPDICERRHDVLLAAALDCEPRKHSPSYYVVPRPRAGQYPRNPTLSRQKLLLRDPQLPKQTLQNPPLRVGVRETVIADGGPAGGRVGAGGARRAVADRQVRLPAVCL